ncbi:MAG TPA: hypothetical protein DHV36_15640 [Desulfobacteraceae bacterium]|nr:hypothetical protein [Desulfobacteraceae bacterium]
MTHTFDFSTGTWTSGRESAATLVIAGDWAPIRDFQPLIEKDPEAIYGDLLPVIREADLSLVNLEAALSDTGTEVCKSGAVFKGSTCHVNGLTAVPFTGVTLGNNHMFDYGVKGFQETVDILDRHHMAHTGAGMDLDSASAPMQLAANGVDVAIVNVSEGEDLTAAEADKPGVVGWDIPAACDRISQMKTQTDVVVAVVHCGLEYIPFPPAYVTNAFKALAEAGADAVIGHHPHVPQGVFFHGKVPVCCSLGNFVFYQPTRLYWRKLGYMVRLHISKQGVEGLDLLPYRITDHGVESLPEADKKYFFKRFKEISSPLDTQQGCQDAWNGFIDYYGTRGFENEVATIMGKLSAEPGKGAAMFRNRLTTAQHFHHWTDLLTRIVRQEMDTSPEWARELAREWLTREL